MSTPPATPAKATVPGRLPLARIALAGGGSFVALATLGALASTSNAAWVLGSFGASCVLLFGFPDGPFSSPRCAIGGHLLSSAVGLAFLHAFGPGWIALGAAGACAMMGMMLTRTVHPPAGSNPVIVFLTQPGWDFLLMPTLAGVLVLVALSRLWHQALERRRIAATAGNSAPT